MVKLVFLCRRRGDISHERYAELLLRDHVPLALRHHPLLRRYVVNIVEQAGPGAPPLDSIGHLWFDSLDDFRERLYDSPEGERIIGRDVARFLGGADAYATMEHGSSADVAERTIVCLGRGSGDDRLRTAAGVVSVVDARLAPAAPDYEAFVELDAPVDEYRDVGYPDASGVVHAYRVRVHRAR